MKRLPFILCIITFSVILSSCKAINVTPANELAASNWSVVNPSSVSASLEFNEDLNEATFTITNEKGKSISINGIFAIDKNNLYITSESLYKTYTFGYKVYKDRLILTYNGYDLTLKNTKIKEP